MQFKTEQIDMSRGVKVDVAIKGDVADEEYEVKVFRNSLRNRLFWGLNSSKWLPVLM